MIDLVDGSDVKCRRKSPRYKVKVSFDGEKYFWMITEKGKIINKNPTDEDLKGATEKTYCPTNICSRCREEYEMGEISELTDRCILYPKNVLYDTDKDGKKTDKRICYRHGLMHHERYCPNSHRNTAKSLRDHRTYENHILGNCCEGISIVKNPINPRSRLPIVPLYEDYRMKDEEELKKVNDIWSKIEKNLME